MANPPASAAVPVKRAALTIPALTASSRAATDSRFRPPFADRPFTEFSKPQDLGEVQGRAAGLLLDLFPATETVGNDQFPTAGLADFGQQRTFAGRHAHLVMIARLLVAERAGHAAAAGVGMAVIEFHRVEDLFFGE